MLQSARAAGDRVFEIVDAPIESDLADDPAFDPIGKVEYRHVHFRYAEGQPVLRDVNFLAEPGQTIALVGATGAGKSSLVAVLLRLYDFQGGEIFVDDRPLRSIPRQAIRRVTGFVSQEAFLFNGTIRENLLFAKPDATDAEIEAALKAANADEFVFRLPDRLEARVGERGVKLSVGEKQRISIARAILKDPPLLILDEATASVDNATERQIQRALDRLLLGRTSFVIAHRLSTVQNADLILVLDRGQIVERGTHDELLGIGGVYDKLYRSGQFTSPDESADLVAGPVL
jgi:ABC-type multidrug transport system fused ATPase/permease subunit